MAIWLHSSRILSFPIFLVSFPISSSFPIYSIPYNSILSRGLLLAPEKCWINPCMLLRKELSNGSNCEPPGESGRGFLISWVPIAYGKRIWCRKNWHLGLFMDACKKCVFYIMHGSNKIKKNICTIYGRLFPSRLTRFSIQVKN